MLPPGETTRLSVPKPESKTLGAVGVIWILLGAVPLAAWAFQSVATCLFETVVKPPVDLLARTNFPTIEPLGLIIFLALLGALCLTEFFLDCGVRSVGKAAKSLMKAFDNRDN